MRLAARIPATRGRVRDVTVRLHWAGGPVGADVTDVMLQPGEPTGVVPNPSDVGLRAGARQWRNGAVSRSTGEVLLLANEDRASPVRVDVSPSGPASVLKVGGFVFGPGGAGWADGQAAACSRGAGVVPVLTERCDGRVAVVTDRPVRLTFAWTGRS